jgi:hypothetical protein
MCQMSPSGGCDGPAGRKLTEPPGRRSEAVGGMLAINRRLLHQRAMWQRLIGVSKAMSSCISLDYPLTMYFISGVGDYGYLRHYNKTFNLPL